jgi:phage baseplate assembly protein W
MPIGLSFPFKDTDTGGIIRPTFSTRESTKSNLIAFLTLKKGQRPMHNDLYSPLYDFIFEPFDTIAEKEMMEALDSKLKKYFPEIKLEETIMEFFEEENLLEVKIVYSIVAFGNERDTLSIEFDRNQQPQ